MSSLAARKSSHEVLQHTPPHEGHGLQFRIRWLRIQWPTLTTLLEIPVVLLVIFFVLGVSFRSLSHMWSSLSALEAVSEVPGAEIAMMEHRAVVGEWPN